VKMPSSIILLLFSSICHADRYIHPDNDFDDQYDKPMWWLFIYMVIGFWAFLSKNGPLREFGKRNVLLSNVLFLLVVPVVLFFIFER
jgi:hypothetical protein